MKKILFAFTMALLSINFSNAQDKIADLFQPSNTQITWLGIDFSQVKLIGQFAQFGDLGSKSAANIKLEFFPEWNSIIIREPSKYDVKGMIRKERIEYNTKWVNEHNKQTPIENLEAVNLPEYSKEYIANHIKEQRYGFSEGLGMLFFVEYLNKTTELAKIHFLVIDMQSREILLQDTFESKPGGIGIKNYWAKAIQSTIKTINDERYFIWKDEILKEK